MSSASSSRSASVSSASPSASGKGESVPKKKFACTHPNCGKSFSRSEHLHRHALNHKEGNNTCTRCSAHFRRRDLLDRHMARHKEKDDEAGGEGLGVLATRKRLWRDADGNIVNTRRPHRQIGTKRRQTAANHEKAKDEAAEIIVTAPPSPPTSIPSTTSNTHGPEPVLAEPEPLHSEWPPLEVDPMLSGGEHSDSLDFLCNASWGSQPQFQTFMGATEDLPYDDIFKPDTAMSFNAPFTTTSYYNWLFDKETESLDVDSSPVLRVPSPATGSSKTDFRHIPRSTDYSSTTNLPADLIRQREAAIESYNIEHGTSDSVDDVPSILASMHMQSNANALFSQNNQNLFLDRGHDMVDFGYHNVTQTSSNFLPTVPETKSAAIESSPNKAVESSISTSSARSPNSSFSRHLGNHGYTNTSMTSQVSTPPEHRCASVATHTPPDSHVAREDPRLPIITTEARDDLMRIISQSQPMKPDGSGIAPSDPLLSLGSLQHYSDLFFTRFNSSYPLLHQATFVPNNIHPYLLMAVLLLGATYSDKEAHMLAVCVHDIMRPLIHSSKDFSTRPDLWMLQTILLVECFGKSRAGEKQHDMSHLYHGLLINLIRRSDCQSASIPAYNPNIHDLEEYWRLAIEAEQKRRLALLCFMWDTQHAVLFSQSLCMNASELKLTLPWDPVIWNASSASSWLNLTQNTPKPPQYLSVLKMYTNPSQSTPPTTLNALSRVLILHGLMSVAWDLNRRDQTSLGLAVNKDLPWQQRISRCYDAWRADFESYTASVLNALSFSPSAQSKFRRFAVANMAIHHTAQLILCVDIIDLQIFTGAKHIIGRPVTVADRNRSRAKINQWVHEDRGKACKAVWHAARLFRDGVRKLEAWGVDEMFHYPWCLYLSTLVCYVLCAKAQERMWIENAFVHPDSARNVGRMSERDADVVGAGGREVEMEDGDDEDGDWDSKAEMNALISAMTRLELKAGFDTEMWTVASKFKTGGLVRCLVKHLGTVRWAVVREGMIVLRNLNT